MIPKISKYSALILLSLAVWQQPSVAGNVEIVKTSFTKQGELWFVDVTLQHADTGWKHYADAWRIVDAKGQELGKRVLWHPHVDEQPFTRSLREVNIPAEVTIVYIEAHDKEHGWSPQKITVDLSQSKGKKFVVNK